MSGPFSSPFGANSNPFGGNGRAQNNNNFMNRVIEEEENDNITSPTSGGGFGQRSAGLFSGPFGGDASADAPPPVRAAPSNYPNQYNFARRTSVSAESLKPGADSNDNWSPPYHEKSADQIERLKRSIEGNFLFSHLEDEQSAQILGALVEKPIPAKGIKV